MDWEQVVHVAERIFKVWRSGGDLEWAKQAWKTLNQAGLTKDSTALEQCQSVIYLICLADYYYGFCTLYREEYLESDFVGWASTFPIHGFQIGQLVGSDTLDDETDPDIFYQKGLEVLTDDCSQSVIDTVEQSFEHRCSLFINLWRSTLSADENDLESPDYLTEKEIFNQQLPSGEFAAHTFGCSAEEIRKTLRNC